MPDSKAVPQALKSMGLGVGNPSGKAMGSLSCMVRRFCLDSDSSRVGVE